MTPVEALRQIVSEAQAYASNRDRFKRRDGHEDYREGVRDGKLQAARIAEKALENAENTGDL